MEKVKPEIKATYPNMKRDEAAMWSRFLSKFPNEYDFVAYNVKVGEGAEIPAGTQPEIANDFKQLTQHKIDVVGFKSNQIDIIELKPYAGTRAVGQVIGYRELFIEHIDKSAQPNLVIVTDTLRPDTKLIAEKQNIKVIVI